ncbi:MAG: YihY/virulence factor BrkB family protein [Pseudomonadota bacterium]|nr:YihY/virulence factor BrkB family protein [Pseudomonadota bacterium]
METAVTSSTTAAPAGNVTPALFQGALKPLYPLYRSFDLWSRADGLRMSAAMSFYGMFSLAPLLVLIVAMLGYWIDRDMLEANLIEQIGDLVGAKGAELVAAAIDSAQRPGEGLLASVMAFGVLVMGATGVFAELQSAMERLWTQDTNTPAGGAWWHTATLRLRGVGYVLAFGFLMLVSLLISSTLAVMERWASDQFGVQPMLGVINQGVSWAITTLLFVAMMRLSAGPKPRLRFLFMGAGLAALLFGAGRYALALYLSTAALVSSYGAAGSLVVLLMWIYFASAVLLYGASVARVLAERDGSFNAAAQPVPANAPPPADTLARATDAASADARRTAQALVAPLHRLSQTELRADAQARLRGPADVLALAAAFGGAYWLTREKQKGRAAHAPQATPAPQPVPPVPPPAAAGALRMGLRWLARSMQARPARATPNASDTSNATRMGQAGLALLVMQLGRWRERHMLNQSARALERDVRAMRRARRR